MTLFNYTAFTYTVLYLQYDKTEQLNVVEHSDSLSEMNEIDRDTEKVNST